MEYAILFIIAFIVGTVIYLISDKWLIAVLAPMVLYTLNILADNSAQQAWWFNLTFGVPLVFFASLLGCYVVQIRRPDEPQSELDEAKESEAEQG